MKQYNIFGKIDEMELIGDEKYRIAKRDLIECNKCDRVFDSRDGHFYKDKFKAIGFRHECKKCTERIKEKKKAKIMYQIKKQLKIDSGAWMGSQERIALNNYKKELL